MPAMSTRLSPLAGLVGLLVLSAHVPAAAAPKAPAINWVRTTGAQQCLGAFELAERVEERVGRVIFVPPSEAEVLVGGHVSPRDGGGYVVWLRVNDQAGVVLGERRIEFDGEDCSVIEGAVVKIISVTLYPNTGLVGGGIPLEPDTAASLQSLFDGEATDPDPNTLGATGPPAPPPPTPGSQQDEPVLAGPEQDGSEASRVDEAGVVWGGDGVVIGGLGQQPDLAAGFGGYLFVRPVPDWTIELGFVQWMDAMATAPDGRALIALMQASLSGCPWSSWDLRLCGGAEVGRLSAAPRDFADNGVATDHLNANLLASAVYRPIIAGLLALRFGLTGILPLTQREYTYQGRDGDREVLFRSSPLALRAEFGMGAEF